ncbi:hypothetical protein EN866_29890 [Mesorhizobium sp. M2D.F.Ca.ET.223.01.1.1]|uniref:hypothetical protein n=2 Tax=Mesorhizobium TaxID=68287 RepID=UPI000FC9DBD6|nr:hypothetical protein [Mesorhizobium sp. M2D.F.Ca.ET.223.01.1.1]TGR86589.1 hypothetical protein EN866_29890 [Mesorhizobium sp. M2D.F.Ca.ET.223.01.1.1]
MLVECMKRHARGVGKKGSGVMEFAVCYDHSGLNLAWSIFVDITAFFALMAPLAMARLIEISREDAGAELQLA